MSSTNNRQCIIIIKHLSYRLEQNNSLPDYVCFKEWTHFSLLHKTYFFSKFLFIITLFFFILFFLSSQQQLQIVQSHKYSVTNWTWILKYSFLTYLYVLCSLIQNDGRGNDQNFTVKEKLQQTSGSSEHSICQLSPQICLSKHKLLFTRLWNNSQTLLRKIGTER
jgi:hypothetical protein